MPTTWSSHTLQGKFMTKRHIIAMGGSDAGISAALRARELDPATEVSVIVDDAYPNFSICGIPYYISGEVGHWSNLAHRTAADLAATGMRVLTDTRVVRINADEHTVDVLEATGTPNPTAIFHAMTVDGMNELDLSYTPPLGSPWDAIQVAAQGWVRECQSFGVGVS